MTPRLRAALLVALGALSAVGAWYATGQQGPDPRTIYSPTHVGILRAAPTATQRTCAVVHGHGALLGLVEVGERHALAAVCHAPAVEGSEAAPLELPAGMVRLQGSEWDCGECTTATHALEVWTSDDTSAPWPCACSSGAPTCERQTCEMGGGCSWSVAPRGAVMQAGQWRGGCLTHSCVAGMGWESPVPEACR